MVGLAFRYPGSEISCVFAGEVEAEIVAVLYRVSWPSEGRSESTRHSAQRRKYIEEAPTITQVHSDISTGELAIESREKDLLTAGHPEINSILAPHLG